MLVLQNIIRQRENDIEALRVSSEKVTPNDQLKILGLIAGLEAELSDLRVILALLPAYLEPGFSLSGE